jgi:hypothetical protein
MFVVHEQLMQYAPHFKLHTKRSWNIKDLNDVQHIKNIAKAVKIFLLRSKDPALVDNFQLSPLSDIFNSVVTSTLDSVSSDDTKKESNNLPSSSTAQHNRKPLIDWNAENLKYRLSSKSSQDSFFSSKSPSELMPPPPLLPRRLRIKAELAAQDQPNFS